MNGEQPAATRPDGPSYVPLRAQLGWLVPLAVICLVIFAYQFFAARYSSADVARLAGEVTVYALFVSMGLTMVAGIFLRPFSARRGGYELTSPKTIAFLTLFSSFLGGTVLGATYGRSQEVVAVSSVLDSLAQFRREAEDVHGNAKQTSFFAGRKPQATGAYGELERLLLGIGTRLEAARNEYLARMDAIGWDSILDASRVERDTSLAESREIVRQAKAIVQKFQAQLAAEIQDARQEIMNLPFGEVERRQILAGFDKSMARSDSEEIVRLDRQSIGQIGNLMELLASSKYGVGWTVQEGKVRFLNDEDRQRAKTIQADLMQLGARQEHLIAEREERAARRLAEQKQRVENGR